MAIRFKNMLGTAAAVAVLAMTLIASPAMAAVPGGASPFGMSSHLMWGYSRAAVEKELDLMAAAGVAWVRVDINWRDIETARGVYDEDLLASLDHVVAAAAARDIRLLPVVMATPAWANGGASRWVPPADDAVIREFMQYMTARYAGRITYWELGNEVNETGFWAVPRADSPERYTRFLQQGYLGAKAGNPDAMIVSAGLAGSDYRYLQEMYDAGARGYFDVLGVHCYSRGRSPYVRDPETPSSTFDGLALMKSTMERNGDQTKTIWLTEAGWQTSTTGNRVTEQQQAQYITEAYQRLYESFPYVETLFVYDLRDDGTDADVPLENYGLMTRDYQPKPAYAAYRAAHDRLHGGPVAVARGSVSASIKSSRRTVRRAATFVVSGRVVAAAAPAALSTSDSGPAASRAVLQRRTGGRWVSVRTARVDDAGRYSLRVRATSRGVCRYRVRVVSDQGAVAATSKTVSVTVR